MRLFRHGQRGLERPGVLFDDGAAFDVGAWLGDYDRAFFEGDGLTALRALDRRDLIPLDAEQLGRRIRLGPPVARPGKLIGVGLNYREHAREAGLPVPEEPLLFLTAPTAIAGPNDDVPLPPAVATLDWEVELALVIGTTVRAVEPPRATSAISGFCLHDDLSVRRWQLEGSGQWTKGKSADGLSPLGPFLVPARDGLGPFDLSLRVNGRAMQRASTADMVIGVPELVATISRYMTLEAGDIVSCGTPAGVAHGRPGRPYLRPGDVVEIDGGALGAMRHVVCSA